MNEDSKFIGRFIEKPANAKLYIFGGPGTGKTESVIRRVVFLKKSLKLNPFSEILILSFTRAAVQELQKRFNKITGLESMALNICTFDVFCFRLNKSIKPNEMYKCNSYEDNIRNGIKAISDILNKENIKIAIENTLLENLKYVIIDEVQDLNGSRAELVKLLLLLLENLNKEWGFMILGDMKQEIFSKVKEGAITLRSLNLSFTLLSPTIDCELNLNRHSDSAQCSTRT